MIKRIGEWRFLEEWGRAGGMGGFDFGIMG
jgi:hypothetical protein